MVDKNYLDENGTSYMWGKTKQRINEAQASTEAKTINGKALKNNPVLSANDVGAVPLDSNGKISSRFLPSYVDDTQEFVGSKSFPAIKVGRIEGEQISVDKLSTEDMADANYTVANVYYDDRYNIIWAHVQIETGDTAVQWAYLIWDAITSLGYPKSEDMGTEVDVTIGGVEYMGAIQPTEGYIYPIAVSELVGTTQTWVTKQNLVLNGSFDEVTSGKIYVNTQENKTYRWSGSQLVEVGGGVALGETAETAFRGDHGAWIYNSIMQGNPDVVTPVITISWTYYKNDVNDTKAVEPEKNAGTETSPQIEIGYRAKYTATWKWTATSGKKNPTATSGTFGTTLPSSGVASASKTTTVTATTTISQTVTAPKQGLVVSNNAVVAPSGTDSASASHKITFLYKRYWGVTTASSITESVIEGLANSELTSTKSKTLTGVTASGTQYYVIAYPKALGALSSIIQDGATPVLSAFTQTTESVTNAAGYTQDYYVYRSNNVGAFTSAKLALS